MTALALAPPRTWSIALTLERAWSVLLSWITSEPTSRAAGAPPLTDEQALVQRAGRGDRPAFDELFRRHVDEVYGRLTRLVGTDPEREDLVQEVFLAAYRGLARFRGDASFSTWLYRIVVHVAYSHLRRRKRRPLELKPMDELERGIVVDGDAVQASVEIRNVLALLERLKPKKRIAFILRVVEGLSLQEIGEIVDAEPAAVGQRVKHAQRELQQLLERRPLLAGPKRSASA